MHAEASYKIYSVAFISRFQTWEAAVMLLMDSWEDVQCNGRTQTLGSNRVGKILALHLNSVKKDKLLNSPHIIF